MQRQKTFYLKLTLLLCIALLLVFAVILAFLYFRSSGITITDAQFVFNYFPI